MTSLRVSVQLYTLLYLVIINKIQCHTTVILLSYQCLIDFKIIEKLILIFAQQLIFKT